jgi:hypothetical protein
MAAASSSASSGLSHTGEYQIIKHDLIKVVVLNLVYLAVLLALFFGNQHTHFVDNWFAKLLHF